jgi:hypothetical protein
MADAVSVLRQEIAKFEQEIAKRRRALTMLTASAAPTKSPAAAAKKSPAAKPQSAPQPAARPSSAPPSLASRIMTHLSANKGKSFSTAEVAQALAKIDKNVTRDNVQRRLGELFKGKKLKRDSGRYSAV